MTRKQLPRPSVDAGEANVAYSVVVPFFNEAQSVPGLLAEIQSVMSRLTGLAECICIDDGSSDATAAVLREFSGHSTLPVRVISFQRNRGQAAALFRGLCEARGEIIITLDGDGQNDPADIPVLLDGLQQADMVCGVRVGRQDSALRKGMSRIANTVRSHLLKDGMRDSGCALKAMHREVARALIPIRTLYSFIPAQAVAAGFRVVQIPVRHRARQGGRSSYGLRAFAFMPLLDMLGMLWYRKRCILQSGDNLGPSSF